MSDAVVYVIDDDDAVRESLEFLLRSAHLAVRTYNSAAAFLMSLPQMASGCIITDVRMPEVSGIDLLKRLATLDIKIPVIVITGHGDVPLAVEAMKLGAVDFFEKPFDGDKIVAAVRSALERPAEGCGSGGGEGRNCTIASPCCRPGKKMFSPAWWPEIPTRRSPMISASARAPWKSTAPM